MNKEQLWKWLEGKYVDPQEFKESLESVLNEVEFLQLQKEVVNKPLFSTRHFKEKSERYEKALKDVLNCFSKHEASEIVLKALRKEG